MPRRSCPPCETPKPSRSRRGRCPQPPSGKKGTAAQKKPKTRVKIGNETFACYVKKVKTNQNASKKTNKVFCLQIK